MTNHCSTNVPTMERLNFSIKGNEGFAIYLTGIYNIGAYFSSNKNKVDSARVSTMIGLKFANN